LLFNLVDYAAPDSATHVSYRGSPALFIACHLNKLLESVATCAAGLFKSGFPRTIWYQFEALSDGNFVPTHYLFLKRPIE
jgi:hypothetical protein